MTAATPPIVIDDHGDLEVYPTVAMAGAAVEAADVLNGGLEAFDSEGRPLRFAAYGNRVALEMPQDSRPDSDQLEGRLRDFIHRVGADRIGIVDVEDAPLSALLEAVLRFERGEDVL